MAAEWTRVRDKKTRHQYSVANVNPDKHEVLDDKPATDASGRPLPALPHKSKGGGSNRSAADKTSDGPEAGAKESA